MLARAQRIPTKARNKLIEGFALLDLNATDASKLAKVSRMAANRYYSHIRERIAAQMKVPRFMGEVEIDEGMFGRVIRRLPESMKADFKGDPIKWQSPEPTFEEIKQRVLVLGIFQRGGGVYTHIIARRNRDTIFPTIHMLVEPGTTIYTDSAPVYETIGQDGYNHKAINHSKGFVGAHGEHVQNIDRFWGFCKMRFQKFKGMSRRTFPLHIKECEFRFNIGNKSPELLKAVKAIAFPRKQRDRKL